MHQRAIALFLAGAATLALAACGGNSNNNMPTATAGSFKSTILVNMGSSPYRQVWCGKKYVLLDIHRGQGSVFMEIEQHILFGYKVRRKVIRSGWSRHCFCPSVPPSTSHVASARAFVSRLISA